MSRKTLRRAFQVFAFVAMAPLLTACDLDFVGVGPGLADAMSNYAHEEAALPNPEIEPITVERGLKGTCRRCR